MNDGDTEDHSNNREIDLTNTAFFFDFDGTLADIVEDPEQARISAAALAALDKLARLSSGALAIVSGRPIATLDRFLAPLKLPLSGVHGLERRDAYGRLHTTAYDPAKLEMIESAMKNFAGRHRGLAVEDKPGSVALHYRQRPDLRNAAEQLACKLAAEVQGVALMRGKMVVELMLGGRSKADAVADFMAQSPFKGRTPLFAGDDVTDEDAFRLVETQGGTAIKIGGGETSASLRAPDRAAFETWLCRAAAAPEPNPARLVSGGQLGLAAPQASVSTHAGRAASVATSGA